MEFRHIEAFIAVADRGSFTRAAGQLHLTQSAVSQLVARLEEELGETLFLRHGNHVEPTQAGLSLLSSAVDVLNARRTFVEHARPGGTSPSGRLRVGTISAATAYLWATTYQAFTVAYPKIDLDVRATSRTLDTADAIVGGMLDVGFMPFPLNQSRLSGHVLGRHQALLVAAPDHPLARRRRLRVQDLSEARFILYEDRMNFRRMADNFFQEIGTAPNVVLETNDTHLIRAMVEVGMGIALLPDWSIQSELASGRLVVLKSPGPTLAEEFGVVHLARGASTLAQLFARFCVERTNLLPEVARLRRS
jgi:DNA-binding transcriptional LysR family regulator